MSKSKDNSIIIEGEITEIAAPVQYEAKLQERTVGLKLVDGIIYPLVNNLGVFSISVGFTFLTKHGNEVGEYFREIADANDNRVISAFGHGAEKFSKFWAWRGNQTVNWLEENLKMNKETAEMTKMVTFSFVDGCLLAPAIKLLEDKRGVIAKNIDNLFNTRPEDESIYDAEPTQTWGSLLGGRALTAAIVVPTAIMMDNLYLSGKNGDFTNLNNAFLNNPGFELAKKIEEKAPIMAQKIGTEVKESLGESRLQTLCKIGVFEAFYTSVCTAGLYVSSRFLANHFDDKGGLKQYPQQKIIKNDADFAPITALDFTSPKTLIASNKKLEGHYGKVENPDLQLMHL